jgi:hypothetical protein
MGHVSKYLGPGGILNHHHVPFTAILGIVLLKRRSSSAMRLPEENKTSV